MSGVRWTTGVGIALGGVGGAMAALLGAPTPPAAPPNAQRPLPAAAATAAPAGTNASVPSPSARPEVDPSPATPVSSAVLSAMSGAPAPSAGPWTPAPLERPTTAGALLKAEMLCDRKKLYDECSRAAEAHELGTAGDVNPLQGKRFRKIALTYLVTACEAGDPHACFVLAAKYRAGPELKASPVRAAALEKRALELCRLRSAPECPAR